MKTKSINELKKQISRIYMAANEDGTNPRYLAALRIWRRYIKSIKTTMGEDNGYCFFGTNADTPVPASVYAKQPEV